MVISTFNFVVERMGKSLLPLVSTTKRLEMINVDHNLDSASISAPAGGASTPSFTHIIFGGFGIPTVICLW